jgi:hypothetical protein
MDEPVTDFVELEEGGIILTAQQFDIDRGYMLTPEHEVIILSPKNKVGYQYAYGMRSRYA